MDRRKALALIGSAPLLTAGAIGIGIGGTGGATPAAARVTDPRLGIEAASGEYPEYFTVTIKGPTAELAMPPDAMALGLTYWRSNGGQISLDPRNAFGFGFAAFCHTHHRHKVALVCDSEWYHPDGASEYTYHYREDGPASVSPVDPLDRAGALDAWLDLITNAHRRAEFRDWSTCIAPFYGHTSETYDACAVYQWYVRPPSPRRARLARLSAKY